MTSFLSPPASALDSPKVLLLHGPPLSGKTEYAIKLAVEKHLPVLLGIARAWKTTAMHLEEALDYDEAEELAVEFRDSGCGILCLEVQSTAYPINIRYFDEVLAFPPEARN